MEHDDFALALQLQSEFFNENDGSHTNKNRNSGCEPKSLVDPYWELTDPNPDIRALFLQFNERFFWGTLSGIEVKWSPRMTLCAGLCCYEGRGGLCSVRLSVPLLQLRPRKDLVETLLHEMIHAYLFVTDNNKLGSKHQFEKNLKLLHQSFGLDHDGHGPEFHKHMYRINGEAGTNISVYHNFHDEVDAYRQHWWRCDGPCRSRKPYFGYVKRSMNRAPSKNDTWWADHQRTCGGTYTKVKEPENYGKKKSKKDQKDISTTETKEKDKKKVKSMDIRIFGGMGKTLGGSKPGDIPNLNSTSMPSASTSASSLSQKDKSQYSVDTVIDLSDDCISLPGGKTPDKSRVPKNKPVSQGGGAKFNIKKPKKVIEFEWTDSEDDEILANMSLSHGDGEEKKNVIDFSDDSEIEELTEDDFVSDVNSTKDKDVKSEDLQNNSELFQGIKSGINVIKDFVNDSERTSTANATSIHAADDNSDVRAKLRQVWGEKDFNTKAGKKITIGQKHNPLSDHRVPGKRPMEAASVGGEKSKKPKLTCDDVPSKSKCLETDKVTPNLKMGNNTNSSKNSNKVTSPIEKLFNKIKDRQISSKSGNTSTTDSPLNSANDSSKLSEAVVVNETESSSQCPVCCKQVLTSSINDHLDLCLTMQAIS